MKSKNGSDVMFFLNYNEAFNQYFKEGGWLLRTNYGSYVTCDEEYAKEIIGKKELDERSDLALWFDAPFPRDILVLSDTRFTALAQVLAVCDMTNDEFLRSLNGIPHIQQTARIINERCMRYKESLYADPDYNPIMDTLNYWKSINMEPDVLRSRAKTILSDYRADIEEMKKYDGNKNIIEKAKEIEEEIEDFLEALKDPRPVR